MCSPKKPYSLGTQLIYCLLFFFSMQARFVRVCERIDATGGEWVAKVIVLDRLGSGLIVHLSNKVCMVWCGCTHQLM